VKAENHLGGVHRTTVDSQWVLMKGRTAMSNQQGKTPWAEVSSDQLQAHLRRRIGLIVGSAVTLGYEAIPAFIQAISDKYGVPATDDYLTTCLRAIEVGASREDINAIASSVFGSTVPIAAGDLVKVDWSGVLSLCPSSGFEAALRQNASQSPIADPVTVLTDLRNLAPPRHIAAHKLVGSCADQSMVLTPNEYRQRKALWRRAARAFGDSIRGGPVLCAGIEGSIPAFLDLIAEMTACNASIPSDLIFTSPAPDLFLHQVHELLDGVSHILVVVGPPNSAAKAAQVAVASPDEAKEELSHPRKVLRDDLAVLVNDELTPTIAREERNRLHELLFSPGQPQWDAIAHGLDFPRSVTPRLIQSVRNAEARGETSAVVLVGPSASGKSMVLKRAAYELAESGLAVLWVRSWFYQDASDRAYKLLESVPASLSRRPIVVFLDDPLSLGSVSPSDISRAADNIDIPVIIVSSCRTSDWQTCDENDFVGHLPIDSVIDLSNDLDELELSRLPEYLVSLGIAADCKEAANRLDIVRTRTASDTLSVLYWLLPGTQHAIEHSVQDEYLRLGSEYLVRQVVLGSEERGGSFLRDAYAMVAVADHYNTPLPLEVLVSALDVGYDKWLNVDQENGPMWGLMYAEDSDDSETVCYRTRNSIVTRILIRTINGGSIGHSGELRYLKRLLSACTGSTPPYREFSVRVLVNSRLLDELDYAEGLDLFDSAIAALPLADKTIAHHRGRWISKKGRDPLAARIALEQALDTASYPYAAKHEADEHIYTSLAANEIDAIDAGVVSLEDGQVAVLDYLQRARSDTFFNPHAVHVKASLLARLIDKHKPSAAGDVLRLSGEAISDVDLTLLVLEQDAMAGLRREKDIEMLRSARLRIEERGKDIDVLIKEADDLWTNTGNQDGFVLVARRLYGSARRSGKGSDYNICCSYCLNKNILIESRNEVVAAQLCAVLVDTVYAWRIMSPTKVVAQMPIPWNNVAARSVACKDSAMYKFIEGVAYAQCDKWEDAERVFTETRTAGIPRRMARTSRAWLMDKDCRKLIVQGTMKGGVASRFLLVEELGKDFHIDRDSRWPREGEIAHAHISFSFMGSSAVVANPKG